MNLFESKLDWIKKDQIAGECLKEFLAAEPETSPLYEISSKLLRQLIIKGIEAGSRTITHENNQYLISDLEPVNGDLVITEKYGIWTFMDEGGGTAPIPIKTLVKNS